MITKKEAIALTEQYKNTYNTEIRKNKINNLIEVITGQIKREASHGQDFCLIRNRLINNFYDSTIKEDALKHFVEAGFNITIKESCVMIDWRENSN